MFWSITTLDLSHNNIKGITGLETLRLLIKCLCLRVIFSIRLSTLISNLFLFTQVPPALRLIVQPHPTLGEFEPSSTTLARRILQQHFEF